VLRLGRGFEGALARPAVIVLALTVATAAHAAPSDRQDQIRHELEQRRSEIAGALRQERSLSSAIAGQTQQIDVVEERVAALGSRVSALEARLAGARRRLASLEERLAQERARLLFLRGQLAAGQRRLSRRLVEIYTGGEREDALAVVLGSRDLEELIELVELQQRVVEQDSRLVDEIRSARTKVERARRRTEILRRRQAQEESALASETAAQRAAYRSLLAQRNQLSALRSTRQRALASVRVQREEWEAEAAALEAESARLAAVIAAARPEPVTPEPTPRGQGGESTPAPSSGYVWPVRGTVVSPYGQRWGRLHSGVDIAAPAGTPIVASASGRVIYAGSMSGYGLIVVIQHAGSIATAYAHNSSIAVSVGQSVAQGQTIAAVGCTGRCFGNHVHFEVRLNGSPVDPMGYL
jgi:septal ring factor EnvC (AmiA/AmiB activator)